MAAGRSMTSATLIKLDVSQGKPPIPPDLINFSMQRVNLYFFMTILLVSLLISEIVREWNSLWNFLTLKAPVTPRQGKYAKQ